MSRNAAPSLFFFQAEDGIRDVAVTGVQTCALPICIVMGAEENHARLFTWNLDEDVFHGDAARGSVRAESINIGSASVTSQFGEDVVLRLREGWGARGPRPERDLFGDVSKGALAIEAASFFRRRSFVISLRCSLRCRWRRSG